MFEDYSYIGADLESAEDMDEKYLYDSVDGRKKITQLQLEKIWEVSDLCERKEITRDDAANIMERYEMNRSTATFYTNAYKRMRRGKPVTATINSKVINVFLTKIKEEYDHDAYVLAIKSVENFIAITPNYTMECMLLGHSWDL